MKIVEHLEFLESLIKEYEERAGRGKSIAAEIRDFAKRNARETLRRLLIDSETKPRLYGHTKCHPAFAEERAFRPRISRRRPVADAANMVVHPMDTVTGLPSGNWKLFLAESLSEWHTMAGRSMKAQP